jgi:hypothetical protein
MNQGSACTSYASDTSIHIADIMPLTAPNSSASFLTYPSLTNVKSIDHRSKSQDLTTGWPYLNMSLEDTGLLYCESICMDGLVSVAARTRSDLHPFPNQDTGELAT